MVGAGGIATSAHLPAYRKLADVELVGIADVRRDRADRAAQQFGVARAFADVDEMLTATRPDAVSVCTPNQAHRTAVLAALAAGSHVLCEKPLAAGVTDAAAMAAAAAATGRILTVGQHYRFTAEARVARAMAAAGEVGHVYYGRAQAIRRRGTPGWGVFHRREHSGGGPLLDIGVHVLDLALYLMDFPAPVEVLGTAGARLVGRGTANTMGPLPGDADVEDFAAGLIRFADGAALLLEASWALNVTDEFNRVTLMGDAGGVEMFPLRTNREAHGALLDTSPAWLPPVNAYDAEVAHFVACCRGEAAPLVTLPQALTVMRIIDGVYRSAATGRAVRLDGGR